MSLEGDAGTGRWNGRGRAGMGGEMGGDRLLDSELSFSKALEFC